MTKKNQKPIAVYYEHPEWFAPLFAELDKRGIDYEKIDAASDFYNPSENFSDKYSLVFNRMSASAYLRNHGNAIFYTRGLLASLEQKNVRVINGYDAFQIEISKALQAALFDSLGVKYPRTRIINAAAQAVHAASDLRFPVIVKPNIGGRGAGIVKFDTPEDLQSAVNENLIDLGIDSTALVQEFAPKKDGFITRVETLNGKFLYAIKIYPTEESFNLCPAEVCQIEDLKSLNAELNDGGETRIAVAPKTVAPKTVAPKTVAPKTVAPKTVAPKMGLKIEKTEPSKEIIETVERIVKAAKIDVGGVEFLIDDRNGDALFYDINALSNFVADAVNLIGFDPHQNLVDFLQRF